MRTLGVQSAASHAYLRGCSITNTPRTARRLFNTTPKAMVKAIYKDVVVAESNNTEVVENNHYFPPDSLKKEYFEPSNYTTVCGWKGTASYYSIKLPSGEVNKDAAWYYPTPKAAAANIKDKVAFWKGVQVK